jgi:chromosomal replication initiator protein
MRRKNSTTLNPQFTFEEFVIGPSNSFAHAAALAVSQQPGVAYTPLLIYGPEGLGKTHLMQAIGHRVLQLSAKSVAYVTAKAWLNEIAEAVKDRKLAEIRKKYSRVDVLLLDDLHFLAKKVRLQKEFYHIFVALYDAGTQIVFASDYPANVASIYPAKGLIELEQKLVSRFKQGLVVVIEPPDLETFLSILRAKQLACKMQINEALLNNIARNIQPDVRSIQVALARVQSASSNIKQPLTVDVLRLLCKDILKKNEPLAGGDQYGGGRRKAIG